VPAFAEKLRAGRRYGTQAWQSDEVVARAKPVAISRVPSLCSGQGFTEFTLSKIMRFFAEPVLSRKKRFFASLRMTLGEGLRMTKSEVLAMTVHKMTTDLRHHYRREKPYDSTFLSGLFSC